MIFAKLRARAEREKTAAAQAPTEPPAAGPNLRRLRIAALCLVACWMLGLAVYYHVALSRHPRRAKAAALEGRSTLTVRDADGSTSEVPVHSARSGPARREEPPPPAPEESKPDPFDE